MPVQDLGFESPLCQYQLTKQPWAKHGAFIQDPVVGSASQLLVSTGWFEMLLYAGQSGNVVEIIPFLTKIMLCIHECLETCIFSCVDKHIGKYSRVLKST